MNTQESTTFTPHTIAEIEAAVRSAKNARAEAMREMLIGVPAQLKHLIASIRPNRQRVPRTGAWA